MSDLQYFSDFSLQGLNTLALPCEAAIFFPADDNESVLEAIGLSKDLALPIMVIGGGSNLVLPPKMPALVLQYSGSNIELIEDADRVLIEVSAGVNWHQLVEYTLDQGWFGLENLALIPGNAGAAPIQNIGAYGVELKDRFHSLSAIDLSSGEQVDMSAEDCVFGYRDSIFKQSLAGRYLITAIRLVLSKSPDLRLDYPALQSALAGISRDEITPRTVADTVIGIRRSKLPDPTQTPNAGSFFKNPVVNEDVAADLRRRFPGLVSYPAENGKAKLAAGWLLENAGWKGHREGHVGMHDRQALVLVNHGGASQRELLGMVSSIQADIVSKFGIELEVEPQVVTAGTF